MVRYGRQPGVVRLRRVWHRPRCKTHQSGPQAVYGGLAEIRQIDRKSVNFGSQPCDHADVDPIDAEVHSQASPIPRRNHLGQSRDRW
jgi:hypothetical protein